MTLLNSLLALGALAFTIPLAIHLFHRSRFKTLDWGAWHLLDSVMRVNRRRLQLANLLLLLLRCLIPILLAFCMARPVLTGFRSLPGDQPRTVVVVVDDSRSMNASAEGRPSRLSLAKTGLTDVMKGLSRRDEVIFLTSSTIDSPPSSMGASTAIERVSNLAAHRGPVELSSVLNAAVAAAQQSSHSECSVLIVSDFQSANIGDATLASLKSVSEQVESLDPQPSIHFWDLGAENEAMANLSVDAVTVDSPAVVAGRNARFSARIQNASDIPTGELRVVWTIDSVALPPRSISISERSSATARLSHRFDDAGVHQVTVSVEHTDSLADDNRRSIGVDVMRQINVLLVDGKPSRLPLEGSADWLSIALSPFAFGGDDQPDAVATRVIQERELNEAIKTDRPEMVMLANVPSLNAEQQAALAAFVIDGGSLVVMDGSEVRPNTFNEVWKSESATLQLPATLGDVVGAPDQTDSPVASLGELNSQYSPWSLLASPDGRTLDDVEIFAYRKLTLHQPEVQNEGGVPRRASRDNVVPTGPNNTQDALESPRVLLRFDNGSPAVVLANRGRGQVCQFAIPCDNSWTTLPTRLPFLPLIQQLVLDLAGRRDDTTVDVGQPLSIPLSELAGTDSGTGSDADTADEKASEKNDGGVRYTIQIPDGPEAKITPTSSPAAGLLWKQTGLPGPYVFRASTQRREGDDEVTTSERTLRIVEVPQQESQLRWAGSDRMSALSKQLGATTFLQISEFKSDDHTRRFGREIWRWLLLLLLIGMLAELLLQQNLLGRSTSVGPR